MGVLVTDERRTKAIDIIRRLTQQMEYGSLAVVVGELGLDTYIEVRDGKVLVRDLTDLQLVALASALAAYVESFHAEGLRA